MTDAIPRLLLDTAPLTAYLFGRPPTVTLVQPWIDRREALISIISCGEVYEYFAGRTDAHRYRSALRILLRHLRPIAITYDIMERYALPGRELRPPHGPGLIGDIDTLSAATAIERNLLLVTTDSDFHRVPGLNLRIVTGLR